MSMQHLWHAKPVRRGSKNASPVQDELVLFIATHRTKKGRVPTIEEIRAHMDWSGTRCVFTQLCNLVYRKRIDEPTLAAIMATITTRAPQWWSARQKQQGILR